MNGSVREVRPGYYQLRVYVGVDPATGRSLYKTKAVGRMPSRRAAARLLPAFYVEAHSERPTPDELRKVRRFECINRGHSFDVFMTHGIELPTYVQCGNCGLRGLVVPVDEKKPPPPK